MSYLRKSDKLVSTVTGKEYPLPPRGTDRDGSKTRQATEQCLRDNAEVTRAAVTRNQRPLAPREEITGRVVIPDNRSIRQRVEQDASLTQPGHNPDVNPWASALASAEHDAKKALLPADRSRAMKRVEMYQGKAAAWQANRDAQVTAEDIAADPRRQFAIDDAKRQLQELAVNPAVSQFDVERARQRAEALDKTGDLEAYWLDSAQHAEDLRAARDARADELVATAADLKAQAKLIRDGKEPEPEPAAAE